MSDNKRLSRREMIRVLGGALSTAALIGCDSVAPGPSRNAKSGNQKMGNQEMAMNSKTPDPGTRMPVVFLPHGGGPWPLLNKAALRPNNGYEGLTRYLEELRMVTPQKPKAVLVVSAHWEAAVPTVMSSDKPPMFYDYYGFPPETYEFDWPAAGEPEVAALVRDHLEKAGFGSAANVERGFDHGTFVPMMVTYPDADVPTFQLSLKAGLDPVEHIKIGRALEPLRDHGVFIVGSGMSYHNLRELIRGNNPQKLRDDSLAFDDWLHATVVAEASRRETALAEWLGAPKARESHPREEHLLPLMVVAGAAGNDVGTTPYREIVMGAHVSAAHFG